MKQHCDRRQVSVIHSHDTWLRLTENWIFSQVHYLPEGIESHVVCQDTVNLETYSVPHLHVLPRISRLHRLLRYGPGRRGAPERAAFIGRIARKTAASVLHSHYGLRGWKDMEAARKAGLKHVVTFYGFDVGRLPKSDPVWIDRYRELFDQVDCVLCEGRHMAQCLVKLGCPPAAVRVHHLGVPTDEIAFVPRVWQPGETLRVLIAASFREKKGIPCALEALSRLRRHVPLEITLIGEADSEPRAQREKEKIMAMIDKCGLTPVIRLLGYQAHAVLMEEAYKHHVFLTPSLTAEDGDTEGGAPVAIIEMMCSGMPVVSTVHCDIPGLIEHGVTGLLAAERDVDGLVEHLDWLAHHPERWQAMILAGRRHMETEFDARTQGQRLASIYRELAS